MVKNRHNTLFCQFLIVFWPTMGSNVIQFQLWGQIWNPVINAHLLEPKVKGGLILYFLTPHCNIKTLVARAGRGWKVSRNETCQCVSTDVGHDKIIGTRCIVEKMPLVIHPNRYGCRDIRSGLHPCSAISLQFLRILPCVFHVLKQWGKCRIYGLCHALVLHHSELVLPHCTPLVCQLRRLKILALYSQRFRLQTAHIGPTAQWQTDLHRKTDRRTPRNLVNWDVQKCRILSFITIA